MTRGVIFASEYNLFLACWLKESGVLGENCDVLTVCSPEMVERLEKTGYFDRIVQLSDKNAAGTNIIELHEAMCGILRGSGRVFRRKAQYMELLSPSRFFQGTACDWDKYFSHTSIFEGMNPYIDAVLWEKGEISCWEHGIISVKGSNIRMYSFPHWEDSHSLWLGIHDISHPYDKLSELCTGAPELVAKRFRERVRVKKVPPIDRRNRRFAESMHFLFAECGQKEILPEMIFFPYVFHANDRCSTAENFFLEEAARILEGKRVAVKPHPSERWNHHAFPHSVSVLPSFHFPWEMIVFADSGWDKRLLVSSYCTTALVSPKVHFDDEPYVLNLSRLFPEINSCQHATLELGLACDVGGLYRNPEKYCIPETWDEVWDFLRVFKTGTSE